MSRVDEIRAAWREFLLMRKVADETRHPGPLFYAYDERGGAVLASTGIEEVAARFVPDAKGYAKVFARAPEDVAHLLGEVERLATELAGAEAEANYIDVKRQRAERETLGAYQAFVQETSVWHARPGHIGEAAVPLVWALGACEEAGEVAKEVKRHVVYGRPLDREAMRAELGDALWYLTALADSLGLSLADVAAANERKVRAKFGHRAGVDQEAEL